MSELKEGSEAPSFNAIDQNGNTISSADYQDKKLILYFYPKDNTPGCTKEACNLRDNYDELKNKNYEIVGVSADTSAKHLNFIAKYDLPFSLIADTDKEVIKAFGCWGLKKFMGREYEGIFRKTFVIENGTIVKLFEKVKTTAHFEQIMEAMN
jgi:thioredoxin-dependent peroxiredoxin